LYEQLRQDAFRARISMAEPMREKLRGSVAKSRKRRSSNDSILKVAGICHGPILSRDIDVPLYGR
jgi:hypothetical protein